jgi:hypothetical protein
MLMSSTARTLSDMSAPFVPARRRHRSRDLRRAGAQSPLNLCTYVENDPVNLTDPMGLDASDAQPGFAWCGGSTPCDPNGSGGPIIAAKRDSSDWIESLLSILQRDFSGGGGSISGGFGPGLPNPGIELPPGQPSPKAEQPSNCPTSIPRQSLGEGLGGTFFLGPKGASLNANAVISIPVSAWRTGLAGIQISASLSISGMIGRGLYVGAGHNYVAGLGPVNPSWLSHSSTDVVQAGGAWGAGGEVAAQFSNSNPTRVTSGSLNVGEHGGYGAYIGGGRALTATLSTPQLFCHGS